MAFGKQDNRFYNGNPNVKMSGAQQPYTLEQVQSIVKFTKDPCEFIDNCVKVVSIDKGIVPFHLYPYQKRIIDAVHHNRFTICKLFRQSGKSTVIAAYCLWFGIFNANKDIVILANKLSAAKELFGRIEMMYEMLPDYVKPGVKEYNKTSMVLENGSRISCAATSASAIRGRSISLCICDEFAFLPTSIAQEFVTSTFPALSSSSQSKLVLISTPYGLNHFYKIWHESEQGINNFVHVEGKWQEIHADDDWFETQSKLLGDPVKVAQELECVTGDTIVRIKNKRTGRVECIPIGELYERMENVEENMVKHG